MTSNRLFGRNWGVMLLNLLSLVVVFVQANARSKRLGVMGLRVVAPFAAPRQLDCKAIPMFVVCCCLFVPLELSSIPAGEQRNWSSHVVCQGPCTTSPRSSSAPHTNPIHCAWFEANALGRESGRDLDFPKHS